MRVIKGKAFAWTTKYSGVGPNELKDSPEDALVKDLSYSVHDMTDAGWVKVGDADVTVQLFGIEEIVSGQVDALKTMKQDVIAKAEAEATRIEGEIQKLLAISYTVEA